MATLVFTALGTAIGGPLGGAIGGLVGQQVDAALFGSSRQGPRLNDLKITTSTYGTAIAQHHGTIRAPGTIIWATDMIEHAEEQGGKGAPSVTVYSYSISFAVALSSRPIAALGRIWADGNLLRGAAGDLKVGGMLRIYSGHGDQGVDPLIAADKGALAPAFRRTAYAVFEELDLSSFGNRIPALTFEIIADDGQASLAAMVEGVEASVETDVSLPGLAGFSYEGGPLLSTLATIDEVYPLALDASGASLKISSAAAVPPHPLSLPEAASAKDGESFGASDGRHARRQPAASDIPTAMRYYDIARDYLAGMQRADGRARPGRDRTIDFPGALSASDARALANEAAERAGWARETMAWRMAELDPRLAPGAIVEVPGKAGLWRIISWEWRDNGTELELLRLPFGPARQPQSDAGSASTSPDLLATPTILNAFELPWDGTGNADEMRSYAALSSSSAGWAGAALFVQQGSSLLPAGTAPRRRAVLGSITAALAPSPALMLERQASLVVQLAATDLALASATPEALANGANRALVGSEILQFALAEPLGSGQWCLTGLLRGRAATEGAAALGQPAGASFVLLESPLALLDSSMLVDTVTQIAASGLGDEAPVFATIVNRGISLRPPEPVHPRAVLSGGVLTLGWKRRARGSWRWNDQVDVPLIEDGEAYLVGVGPVNAPVTSWSLGTASLTIDAASYSAIQSAHSGQPIWVRQSGRHTMSNPLLLFTLP